MCVPGQNGGLWVDAPTPEARSFSVPLKSPFLTEVSSCFTLPFLHLAAPGQAEFQHTMIFNIQTANGQGTRNLAYL